VGQVPKPVTLLLLLLFVTSIYLWEEEEEECNLHLSMDRQNCNTHAELVKALQTHNKNYNVKLHSIV
jgi:hypothetical protein